MALHLRPARHASSAACPLCGKWFKAADLPYHADACADRADRKLRAASSPRKCSPAGVTVNQHRKRLKAPVASGAHLVEVVPIDGVEFRSQSSRVRPQNMAAHAASGGAARFAAGAVSTASAARAASSDMYAANGLVGGCAHSSAAMAAIANAGTVASASASATPPQRPIAAASSEEVIEADADRFLTAVRTAFAEEPQKHAHFMDVMVRFQSGTLTTVEVMKQAAALLADHGDLLAAFNAFLPDGHHIERLASSPAGVTDAVRDHSIGTLGKDTDSMEQIAQHSDSAIDRNTCSVHARGGKGAQTPKLQLAPPHLPLPREVD